MAKHTTLIVYFLLFLQSVIGAVLQASISGELSPHVLLLSSARPFPVDEHMETAEVPPMGNDNKFILTFYQNLLDGHSLPRAAQMKSNTQLEEANTIRSMTPEVNLGSKAMTFKIPALGSGESVQHMELRFNKATSGQKWLEIGIKRMNKTIRTFLQSAYKNQDITSLIRPWISDEYDDLSVEIKQKSNSSQDDALLVLFTKDSTHLQKLSAISKVSMDETEHHSRSRRSTRRRRKDCHLSSMQVNFNRLGWGQYIIFPKFYDAKVCKGICVPAVTQEKAATNHAVMQSLMRESTNGRIPLPCCVPKSLSPISILYVEEKQFLVKHHKNMVVEECGCE